MSNLKNFSSDNICKVSPHIVQNLNLYDGLSDINISHYTVVTIVVINPYIYT